MLKISGEVKSKRRDGKAIQVEDNWYSVMFASGLDGVNKGDYVDLEYTTKPNPAGGDYRNIKSVSKAAAPASRPVSAVAPSTPAGRSFPVHPLSPERAIIRQNALGHAVKVFADLPIDGNDFGNATETAQAIIELARVFEAYSAGDLDREMAEESVREMLAMERS